MPMNQAHNPVRMPLPLPTAIPEKKTCFLLASGPDCLHASGTLTEVVLARAFPQSDVAFVEECTGARTSLEGTW